MAGQTSAILKGFDYQHLLSWYHVLSLKTSNVVKRVRLENEFAGHVDDLTVEKSNGTVDFYQVKYHVGGGHYSMLDLLTAREGKSLMEKFWVTWNELIKQYSKNQIRLILYSNWVYHPDDKILICINGDNGHLSDLFFNSGPRSDCGKEKGKWKKAHSATDENFNAFAKSISFQLGRNFTDEIKLMIADRMQLLGLQYDENAMLIAVGIIKKWIKEKTEYISTSVLEKEILDHKLYMPSNTEKAASVYFATIKSRKFDLAPDYILDWRQYFKETSGIGGHELINAEDWNKTLLPELRLLEDRINTEVTPTLIRARGFARLSAWFAFGYTFSQVAGYTIEVNQQEKIWRTDEQPSSNFNVISENQNGEIFGQGNKTVAVGISVTGSLELDVRKYINEHGGVDALLLLRPEVDLGPSCFQTAADVTAFSEQIKAKTRAFVKENGADTLILFYFGPLSGACFIGHQLNAICKEVKIMENSNSGGYIESFVLY